MSATTQLEKLSNKIADRIVEFVNAFDGPVTLSQIDREVQGFATKETSAWYLRLPGARGNGYIWEGMTEAGVAALENVIFSRKVAIQFVTPQPYLLDQGACYLANKDWHPVMLLPASAANFSAPNWLVRLSPRALNDCMAGAATKRGSVGPLTPHPLRFTADYFSVGDPRSKFSAVAIGTLTTS